jgi:hypothetical protein
MLEQCQFPTLDEPFATALREGVAYVIERYKPLAIIAAGSILRGEGDIYSDIDMYVLFEGNYRQLVHKRFNGIAFQLFCNPLQRIPRYFKEERTRVEGGNSTAHMIATGYVILDRDPRIAEIRQQAHEALQQPPHPNPEMLQHFRYQAVDGLENVLDLRESDPDMAMIIMGETLTKMLRYYFLKQGQYIPRHKDYLKIIREDDPELAALLHLLFAAQDDSRYDILLQIADKTIEVREFFEYEWQPEEVQP